MSHRLTVAVTGLNATDNPAPGVPVIRAIRAAAPETRVVGLAYQPLDPGNYMEGMADHTYLLPYPSLGADVFFERLMDVHRKTPIDVLLPTLDAELAAVLALRDRLHAAGIRTFLPEPDALDRRAKSRLPELAEVGLPGPRSLTCTDPAQLSRIGAELGWPLVVKGRFYDAKVAHTAAQASAAFQELSAKWGLPIVVQAFVPGEEFDVIGLGDGEGGLVGAVAMRKMQLTDKGKAWGGVTIHSPELLGLARRFAAELRWRGGFELEVMRSSKDGRLGLIEVNPRFPAWVYLAVGAGQNLPWAAVRLALGERVAPFPAAPAGVMFLRHSFDQILSLSDYEALTVRGELHREPALVAGSDLLPTFPHSPDDAEEAAA